MRVFVLCLLNPFVLKRRHVVVVRSTLAAFSAASSSSPFPTLTLEEEEDKLLDFVSTKKNLLVITGAGISTQSGIPDYRGPNGSYSKGHKPMMHQDFVTSEHHRKRYWARSLSGWKTFALSRPNQGHFAIAQLQQMNIVSSVVTQNVDRLHSKAGTPEERLVDLHGRNDRCECLACKTSYSRALLHKQLELLNPLVADSLQSPEKSSLRADGDAELGGSFDYSSFQIPSCTKCGGILKPTVVFFGDNVPRERVTHVQQLVMQSDGVLCVGTSLEVFSAYRFVKQAHDASIPIAILNVGPTRVDKASPKVISLAARVDDDASRVLSKIVTTLSS